MATALRSNMTDTPNPTPDPAPQGDPAPSDPQAPAPTFTQEDVDRIVKERVTRERGKFADYDDLKAKAKASLSEAEQAVAEAEARGRTTAVTEFGTRLARTEFDAAAARRNPGFDMRSVLEDLNLAKFVGDDGEPDSKAIEAAVERLVPVPSGAAAIPPPFDLGNRGTTAPSTNPMNDLIRASAGRR